MHRTLRKIHTFVDAQKDANKIKSFFRQGEMSGLLKDCREGLKQAADVFKVGGFSDSCQRPILNLG